MRPASMNSLSRRHLCCARISVSVHAGVSSILFRKPSIHTNNSPIPYSNAEYDRQKTHKRYDPSRYTDARNR